MPVGASGPFTLLFPTWVPGNHGPTARIERLAGLIISARGQRLNWTRDPIDMHAFHVDIPSGANSLQVEFQYLSATSSDEGRVVMTPEILNLQWFSLALYPAGYYARQLTFDPEVTLPPGWQFTTQMEVATGAGTVVHFRPLSFESLLNSPLFAGRYFRRFELGTIGHAPHI